MSEWLKPEEEVERQESLDPGVAAIAIALDHAKANSPPSANAVEAFLASQRELIGRQLHHLDAQSRGSKLDHWSKRLKVAVQALTLLVGMIVLAAVAAMAWDARNADGLVIKQFSAPPSLAQRGMTGEALASKVLDRLNAIAEVANPQDRQKSVRGGETEHVSLAIPETGISLGQLEQWLRDKLGHERAVSGDLSIGADGKLTLDSRIGAHPLPSQTGAEADLDAIAQKVAEAIYAKEQPTGWYDYLANQNRFPEALQFAQKGLRTARTREQRALSLGGIGLATAVTRGEPLAAVPYYERAMAEDPEEFLSPTNLASLEAGRGHDERAYTLEKEALRRVRASHEQSPETRRAGELLSRGNVERYTGDYQAALRDAERIVESGAPGAFGDPRGDLAEPKTMLHDYRGAAEDLNGLDTTNPVNALVQESGAHLIAYLSTDWIGAMAHLDHVDAIIRDSPPLRALASNLGVEARRAITMAKLGRLDEARRLADPFPNDCVACLQAKADVAGAAGDHAAEDRFYAEAVRLTPSLPAANEAWGRAFLARGQASKALARFDAAIAKGPRFCDAFEGRGEALLMLGDPKAAAAAFERAAATAPKWGRLHLKWAEALAKLGNRDQARAALQVAGGLDLTPAERAELAAQKI
jgi:tetratricopeptide (TPR) repeat protein